MKGLILDDDNAVCEYIASALEESAVGYEIFLDPIQALGQLEGNDFDFAFIDINLPNMDGFEFSRRFKDRFPEADIIFITGHGDYEKAVQAIKAGAYDYIQKAFRRLDITLCVTRLLEKRKLYENQKRMALLEFANDVALELMHELRNPLVAIGGFSKLVATKDLPEDRLRRFVDIIFKESVRLEGVIKEILAHLKVGARRHVAKERDPPPSPLLHIGKEVEIGDPGDTGRKYLEIQTGAQNKGLERRGEMRKEPKKRLVRKQAKTTRRKRENMKLSSKEIAVADNGIKKKYLADGKMCEVTFRLSKIAAPKAETVCIVGDFNDWDLRANRMKRLKNGDYTIKLGLEPGNAYQFRYLIDESQWENDWNADSYVKNPFGDSDNSVVDV